MPANPYSGRGMIVGEGKPENQNSATIFCLGEALQVGLIHQCPFCQATRGMHVTPIWHLCPSHTWIIRSHTQHLYVWPAIPHLAGHLTHVSSSSLTWQAIDMNQDNVLAEALKVRGVLSELKIHSTGPALRLLDQLVPWAMFVSSSPQGAPAPAAHASIGGAGVAPATGQGLARQRSTRSISASGAFTAVPGAAPGQAGATPASRAGGPVSAGRIPVQAAAKPTLCGTALKALAKQRAAEQQVRVSHNRHDRHGTGGLGKCKEAGCGYSSSRPCPSRRTFWPNAGGAGGAEGAHLQRQGRGLRVLCSVH